MTPFDGAICKDIEGFFYALGLSAYRISVYLTMSNSLADPRGVPVLAAVYPANEPAGRSARGGGPQAGPDARCGAAGTLLQVAAGQRARH